MDFTNAIYSSEPRSTPIEDALLQERLSYPLTSQRTTPHTIVDRALAHKTQKALIQQMIQEELAKTHPKPEKPREKLIQPHPSTEKLETIHVFILFVLIVALVICFIQYKQTETLFMLLRVPASQQIPTPSQS